MTSRNLFFKLLKEDLKRRLWTISLFSIFLFLLYPVVGALRLQNRFMGETSAQQIEVMKVHLGPENRSIITLIMICAIVCGLSTFFYLHSKKKVDLYHSLPVKREMLFAANYINGLLLFLIPFVINILLTLGIGMLNRLVTMEVFSITLQGLMINSLYYCMIYTVTIIAVMLTGNIWTSFLGTIVFMSYGYILSMVKEMYYSTYFSTYYSIDGLNEKVAMLSPIQCYYHTVNSYQIGNTYLATLGIHLFITIVLIGLAVFIFKKRPSEAAGKSMAFEISKPIIKFLLVIPLSLVSGMILKEAVSYNHDAWLMFGIVFSMVIIYAIIQVIFNSDIRSAFHHKRQFLVCALITFAIVGYFRLDPFSYDEYIPKESSIKSIGVYYDFMLDDMQYFDYSGTNEVYIDPVDYHLKQPIHSDISDVYSLCKQAVKNEANNSYNVGSNYMVVRYNLKDGRFMYRSYHFDLEDNTLVKALYQNKEFKAAHYPIFKMKYSDVDIITVNVGEAMETSDGLTTSLTLTGDKVHRFLDIYKEELSNLSYDQYKKDKPVGNFNVTIGKTNRYNGYYVYPTFTKSIAFLKENGYDYFKN